MRDAQGGRAAGYCECRDGAGGAVSGERGERESAG